MSNVEEIESPRGLLRWYVRRLELKDLPWYKNASTNQYNFWHALWLISLIASLATATIAALMEKDYFGGNVKVFLVVLPLVGAAANALLSQFRFRELEDLRERGRIEMEDIVFNAKRQLAAAPDDEACIQAYEQVRKRVYELDIAQHRSFTELRAGEEHHRKKS